MCELLSSAMAELRVRQEEPFLRDARTTLKERKMVILGEIFKLFVGQIGRPMKSYFDVCTILKKTFGVVRLYIPIKRSYEQNELLNAAFK